MARYDVDAGSVTYKPSEIEWVQPQRFAAHDGGSVRSIYWSAILRFESDGGELLPAAFEEWEAFDDGSTHSIVLPPANDVLGGDATHSNVYIEIDEWPAFLSVNVETFSVKIGPVEFTS